MNEDITQAIMSQMPDAEVEVAVEGNRARITVVSQAFEGMSRVKKQQAVYACINGLIAAGTLHAVTIRALTPDEAR